MWNPEGPGMSVQAVLSASGSLGPEGRGGGEAPGRLGICGGCWKEKGGERLNKDPSPVAWLGTVIITHNYVFPLLCTATAGVCAGL